jgi:hypothetical protein
MIFSSIGGVDVQFEYKILTHATYSAKSARFLDSEGSNMVISGGERGTQGMPKVNL